MCSNKLALVLLHAIFVYVYNGNVNLNILNRIYTIINDMPCLCLTLIAVYSAISHH